MKKTEVLMPIPYPAVRTWAEMSVEERKKISAEYEGRKKSLDSSDPPKVYYKQRCRCGLVLVVGGCPAGCERYAKHAENARRQESVQRKKLRESERIGLGVKHASEGAAKAMSKPRKYSP